MVFTSYTFLFTFLPSVLIAYYLTPRRFRNLTLALFSYLFYFWGIPKYAHLLIISTLVDYYSVKGMLRWPSRKKSFLLFSICCNLGLLGYFKYYNFFIGEINQVLASLKLASIPFVELVLPIGISFYTFQSLSYSIDSYFGRVKPANNIIDFFCYVSMFPQLVAGPVVRFSEVEDQLQNRKESWDKFILGVWFFMVGFCKKVLIANKVDPLTKAAFSLKTPEFYDAWTGLIAFSVQLYFDFSGYSDMAIGLGLMFGFILPINFDSPYKSESVSEFWRRWHISLMMWIKLYVFFPLIRAKRNYRRIYTALFASFVLSGLWHGANWTFILWGAFHGALVVTERYKKGKYAFYLRLPKPLRIFTVYFLFTFSGFLFCAPNIIGAWEYLQGLCSFWSPGELSLIGPLRSHSRLLFIPLGLFICFFCKNANQNAKDLRVWMIWPVFILFLVACLDIANRNYYPFVYYQF